MSPGKCNVYKFALISPAIIDVIRLLAIGCSSAGLELKKLIRVSRPSSSIKNVYNPS
jgi:hypothetical protein